MRKKLVITLALALVSFGSFAQMKSKFTNVTTFGGHDGTIDLRVSGGEPPYTYLWNDGSADEDRNNLKSGAYTVLISDNSGCAITASFNITQPEQFQNSSAFGTNNFTSEIEVFPNPSEGIVNVHFTGTQAKDVIVKVTDVSGKIISEKNLGSFNGQLQEKVDLTAQSKGIYMIEVITERESYITKVVVQ